MSQGIPLSSSSKLQKSNVEIPYPSSQTSPTLISSGKFPPPETQCQTRLEVETTTCNQLGRYSISLYACVWLATVSLVPQASPAPGALAVIGSCRAHSRNHPVECERTTLTHSLACTHTCANSRTPLRVHTSVSLLPQASSFPSSAVSHLPQAASTSSTATIAHLELPSPGF